MPGTGSASGVSLAAGTMGAIGTIGTPGRVGTIGGTGMISGRSALAAFCLPGALRIPGPRLLQGSPFSMNFGTSGVTGGKRTSPVREGIGQFVHGAFTLPVGKGFKGLPFQQQTKGVQFQTAGACRTTILHITEQREAPFSKLEANLMGSTGVEPNLHQTHLSESAVELFKTAHGQSGFLPFRICRGSTHAFPPILSKLLQNPVFQQHGRLPWTASRHPGQIFLHHTPVMPGQSLGKEPGCAVGFGNKQNAGGIAIQTVHGSGHEVCTGIGLLKARGQTVRMPGSGMHRKTGRLEEYAVFVCFGNKGRQNTANGRHGLDSGGSASGKGWDSNQIGNGNPIKGTCPLPVDPHLPGSDPAVQHPCRFIESAGQELKQFLSRFGRCNNKRFSHIQNSRRCRCDPGNLPRVRSAVYTERATHSRREFGAIVTAVRDHNREVHKRELAGRVVLLKKGLRSFKPGEAMSLQLKRNGKPIRVEQSADNKLKAFIDNEEVETPFTAERLVEKKEGKNCTMAGALGFSEPDTFCDCMSTVISQNLKTSINRIGMIASWKYRNVMA